MVNRVSQEVAEVALAEVVNNRASQLVVESILNETDNLRVSQLVVEGILNETDNSRTSQLVLEGLLNEVNHNRVSQLVVEVLLLSLEFPVPPVYPTLPGIGYSVHWIPKFHNLPSQVTITGAEIDLATSTYAIHDFELTYDFLQSQFGNSEFKTMMGFFLMQQGNVGRCLFKNPDDYSVSRQLIGIADGVGHLYQIVRTFGAGDYQATEPVGYVDTTQPFNVYYDGILQPSSTGWSIVTTVPGSQQLDTGSTLSMGVKIEVDMNYWYYCKLAEDNMDFEKFMSNLFTIKKVVLRSCRPGA